MFADRDGTLLEHVDYLGDPDRVALLPGVKAAVHRFIASGAAFFIFTNQSGVERGYYSLSDVYRCHERMFDLLELQADQLAGICIATGLPESPDPYRKPSPRFIEEALERFHLHKSNAHMVGDTFADLHTAWNAGVQAWALACGKPELPDAHKAGDISGDYRYADDFPAVVTAILEAAESETNNKDAKQK